MLSRISRCRPGASTLDDIVQVEDGLLQPLSAAEHDELTRQVGGQFRRVTNGLHLGRARIARRQVVRQHLEVADNRRQHVVEIVGDPPASRPTVSMFWAWRSCDSRAARTTRRARSRAGRRRPSTSAARRPRRRQSGRRSSSDGGTRREGWHRGGPARSVDRRCGREVADCQRAGTRRAGSRRRRWPRG